MVDRHLEGNGSNNGFMLADNDYLLPFTGSVETHVANDAHHEADALAVENCQLDQSHTTVTSQKEFVPQPPASASFNVGGKVFQVSFESLRRSSTLLQYLGAICNTSSLNASDCPFEEMSAFNNLIGGLLNKAIPCIFIDRDPALFKWVLTYLRTGEIDVDLFAAKNNVSVGYTKNPLNFGTNSDKVPRCLSLLKKEFDFFQLKWPSRCFLCNCLFDTSRDIGNSCLAHRGQLVSADFTNGNSACVYTCCYQGADSPGCTGSPHISESSAFIYLQELQSKQECTPVKTKVVDLLYNFEYPNYSVPPCEEYIFSHPSQKSDTFDEQKSLSGFPELSMSILRGINDLIANKEEEHLEKELDWVSEISTAKTCDVSEQHAEEVKSVRSVGIASFEPEEKGKEEPLPVSKRVWRVAPEEGKRMPLLVENAAAIHSVSGILEVNADNTFCSSVNPSELLKKGGINLSKLLGSDKSLSSGTSIGNLGTKFPVLLPRVKKEKSFQDNELSKALSSWVVDSNDSVKSDVDSESVEMTYPHADDKSSEVCSYFSETVDKSPLKESSTSFEFEYKSLLSDTPTSSPKGTRLFKTRMCPLLKQGSCTRSPDKCNYAHSLDELKATQEFYKTQPCYFFNRGHCKAGIKCRYAHGVSELRTKESIMWFQVSDSGSGTMGCIPISPSLHTSVSNLDSTF